MSAALLIDYSALLIPRWYEDPYSAPETTEAAIRMLSITYPALAVCVDDPDATSRSWRRALDPQYKSNRPQKPPDLVAAIARGIEIVRTNFPVWGSPCHEADDVIASAAIRLQRQSDCESVEIYGIDKDLAQLVVDRSSVFCSIALRSHSGDLIDVTRTREKYGVHPLQMGDWLAIVGDRSDNVEGVPRIGEKGAAEFLARFGSWAGIVAAAENLSTEGMTDNVRASILASRERFALSRKLVELVRDLPIPIHQIFDRAKQDPLALVQQPWPLWPQTDTQKKENNVTTPLSFAEQMAALQASLPPGSALPGQINANAAPGQMPAQQTYVDPRQAPPAGYRYAGPPPSMDLTFDAPRTPPAQQPIQYGYAPNGAPVASQQSLSTPHAVGAQLALPAADGAQQAPAATATPEAPKRGRGRPKAATLAAAGTSDPVSDEEALAALIALRSYFNGQ